jgi:SAM-dependent methyltransferase
MAGTGFVAETIGPWFDRTLRVDAYALTNGSTGGIHGMIRGDVMRNETFAGLPQVDFAVCLAGFHHVLAEPASCDRQSHYRRRVELLRQWRHNLLPGGRLIVVDVSSPYAQNKSRSTAALDDFRGNPAPAAKHDQFVATSTFFRSLLDCHSLSDYLQACWTLAVSLRIGDCQPALFFDDVVSTLSPQGHVADFNSREELMNAFQEAGFKDVYAFVAPTPWLFTAKADALWFVHELLSIGTAPKSPGRLGATESSKLEARLNEYLRLRCLPDGTWALAWELMYVFGDNT